MGPGGTPDGVEPASAFPLISDLDVRSSLGDGGRQAHSGTSQGGQQGRRGSEILLVGVELRELSLHVHGREVSHRRAGATEGQEHGEPGRMERRLLGTTWFLTGMGQAHVEHDEVSRLHRDGEGVLDLEMRPAMRPRVDAKAPHSIRPLEIGADFHHLKRAAEGRLHRAVRRQVGAEGIAESSAPAVLVPARPVLEVQIAVACEHNVVYREGFADNREDARVREQPRQLRHLVGSRGLYSTRSERNPAELQMLQPDPARCDHLVGTQRRWDDRPSIASEVVP
jgi:hypothetical protein